MIEMKDMTREERTLITIQCESFFLDYVIHDKLVPVYDAVISCLGRKHRTELWVIITAACKALRYGLLGSQITLNKTNYTTANKVHGKAISYTRMLRVLEMLEDEGYLTVYKGFFDLGANTSIKSCMLFSEKFLALFEGVNVARIGQKRDSSNYIELKDSKTKEVITDLSKIRGVKSKRKLVEEYNKFLETRDIRVKGRKASPVFKRVYADDLKGAGRWYSFGGFQTAPSTLRPTITIDGMACTELDYSSIHAKLLYSLEGISKPLDFEPYSIPEGTIKCDDSKSERSFCKCALLFLLNASSRRSAIQAIRERVLADLTRPEHEKSFPGLDMTGKGSYSKVFDAIEERNKEISHRFYEDKLWAQLQHLDSEIAAYVIQEFTKLGKVVLPWHDSFVVCKEDSELLFNTMREAWYSVLGTYANCKIDKRF